MSGFIRRRRVLLLSAVFLLALLSAGASLLAPPVYRASTRLEAEVPGAVQAGAGSPAAWLEAAGAQVLSSEALLRVVQGLELPAGRPPGEVAEALGRKLALRATAGGGERADVVGFSVTVTARDPGAAAGAAEGVAALFLAENERRPDARPPAAPGAGLEEERRGAEAAVSALETELAAFGRAREAERADEALRLERAAEELRRAEQIGRELEELGRRAGRLEERRAALRAELAGTPPTIVVEEPLPPQGSPPAPSPEDEARAARLQDLQNQLAALERILGPRHPDVVRLRGAAEGLAAEHRRREERLAAEERERAARAAARARREVPNPARGALEGELATVQRELDALERERGALRNDSARLRQQAAASAARTGSPQAMAAADAEREWARLNRELEEARARLAEVRARAEGLQAAGTAPAPESVRYRRVGTAAAEVERVEPNRGAIFLVGLLVSLVLAVGAALLRDVLDRSVKTPEGLGTLAGLPVLAVLPYGVRPEERRRRGLRRAAWSLAGAGGLAALGVTLDRHVGPLATLWPDLQALVARSVIF
ncbi:MAG: hypothetical protein SCH98_15140 [Deferrisomatales bacterium]|nr:hypothetical protein [Deferrisomatales bacterium]